MASILSAIRPQSSLEVYREVVAAGAKSDEQVISHVVGQLKKGALRFGIEDPDNPNTYKMMTALGPLAVKAGVGSKGVFWTPEEE